MWDLRSLRSLNTDPMSCIWIGHFSAFSGSWDFFWGGGLNISPPSWEDSCSFSLPSSPIEQPCAPSASPECQHSCICLSFTFWLFIASPHSWLLPQRTAVFICGTFTHHLICLCFPASPLLLFFFSQEWQLCRVVNTFPHSHEPLHPTPSTKNNNKTRSKKNNNEMTDWCLIWRGKKERSCNCWWYNNYICGIWVGVIGMEPVCVLVIRALDMVELVLRERDATSGPVEECCCRRQSCPPTAVQEGPGWSSPLVHLEGRGEVPPQWR